MVFVKKSIETMMKEIRFSISDNYVISHHIRPWYEIESNEVTKPNMCFIEEDQKVIGVNPSYVRKVLSEVGQERNKDLYDAIEAAVDRALLIRNQARLDLSSGVRMLRGERGYVVRVLSSNGFDFKREINDFRDLRLDYETAEGLLKLDTFSLDVSYRGNGKAMDIMGIDERLKWSPERVVDFPMDPVIA